MKAKLKEFIVTRSRKAGLEAWNAPSGRRVILFMDVLRPFPYLGGLLNRTIIKTIAASPFPGVAKTNHEAWERRVPQLWN